MIDDSEWSDLRGFSRARARIGVLLGLLFLAGPLSDLLDQSLGGAHLAALLLGLGLFVALYLSLLPPSAWLPRLGPEAALLVLASLPVRQGARRVGKECRPCS